MSSTPSKPQSGYILPATALLLIPMVVFMALAVDVAGWTVQANRVQSAADASSLAGAALLPDQPDATAAAIEIAAANGYVDGVDGVSVNVTFPSVSLIQVEITGPADRYFSNIVTDTPMDVTRVAEATSLAPVGFGSPTNVLGFGPYSLDGIQASNYWLLEGNDCTPAEFGDYRAAQRLEAPWCGNFPATESPVWKRATDGREGGNFYVVTIPPGVTVPSTLNVFDPGKCPAYGSKPQDRGWDQAPNDGTRLEFRSWDSNNTALLDSDDSPSSGWWGSNDCAADLGIPAASWTNFADGWTTTPFTFPPNTTGEPETHLIQSRVLDSVSHGWNYHSFWVQPNDGTTSCLSIGSPSCPTIGAEDWATVGAQGNVIGDPMFLYMTEVGIEHAGRTLEITVWDTGEGMDNIQVIDPTGKSLDFTWTTDDPAYGSNNPADTCGPNPCLDLDPDNNNYPPKLTGPGWTNHWRFNGRLTTLSIPLDAQTDFSAFAASGQGNWFRLRFEPRPGNVAQEWATFSVRLTGDPIRLTY